MSNKLSTEQLKALRQKIQKSEEAQISLRRAQTKMHACETDAQEAQQAAKRFMLELKGEHQERLGRKILDFDLASGEILFEKEPTPPTGDSSEKDE